MNNPLQNFKNRRNTVLHNQPSFLVRLAELMGEGYTFSEGATLLLPHHVKDYQTVLSMVEADLKRGFGVTHILRQLGFSTASLLPVAIAEMDGQLVRALEGMADRLRKKEGKQKKLKSLLVYPCILFVFISALLIAFRRFFLPNMEMLMSSRQEATTGFAKLFPLLVTKIPDFMVGAALLTACSIIIGRIVYKRLEPREKIRLLLRVPIIRTIFIMRVTRDFSGELGGLLESGLSMQNALAVLIDQEMDDVLSEIASNVKDQVVYGETFHVATKLTVGLTDQLAAFAKHGEDSGHLSKELLIYSGHLGEAVDEKLTKGLTLLQPILFGLIAVCILAAYLALLLPVYGMMDQL